MRERDADDARGAVPIVSGMVKNMQPLEKIPMSNNPYKHTYLSCSNSRRVCSHLFVLDYHGDFANLISFCLTVLRRNCPRQRHMI